jgi:uncharacterized protein
MKILVIGATGFIGRHLFKELVSEGHHAVGISRNPEAARDILGMDSDIHQWDGISEPTLVKALEGVDGIANLAGESIAKGRWTKKRKMALLSSRAGTGKTLAAALLQMPARPSFLIQASATGYYGPQTTDPVDETAGPGTGFLSELNQQWESSVHTLKEAGMRVMYIRTGIVLGADGGLLKQLLLPFSFYAGTTLGSGRQYLSWIHLMDEVRAIMHLINNPESEGPYNLTSPKPMTMAALIHEIAEITGKPAWLKVPGFALRFSLGQMAEETVLASQQILPSRLLSEGFRFNFPEIGPALKDLLSKPGP